MHLRPRPRGMEHRGYTRVSARRWIKDPIDEPVVPSRIKWMSFGEYRRAMRESEDHRAAVKDCPQRPGQLEDDFYEPEIFSVRRSDKSGYLQRQDTMDEPCKDGENQSKHGRYSRKYRSSPIQPIPAAIKVERDDQVWFIFRYGRKSKYNLKW